MAVVEVGTISWGGPISPLPGIIQDFGPLNAPVVRLVLQSPELYPDTWSLCGIGWIGTSINGLFGVVQRFDVPVQVGAVIVPRVPERPGTPGELLNYRVYFEPVPWIETGILSIQANDAPTVQGSSNYGGGVP